MGLTTDLTGLSIDWVRGLVYWRKGASLAISRPWIGVSRGDTLIAQAVQRNEKVLTGRNATQRVKVAGTPSQQRRAHPSRLSAHRPRLASARMKRIGKPVEGRVRRWEGVARPSHSNHPGEGPSRRSLLVEGQGSRMELPG